MMNAKPAADELNGVLSLPVFFNLFHIPYKLDINSVFIIQLAVVL